MCDMRTHFMLMAVKAPKSFKEKFGQALETSLSTELSSIVTDVDNQQALRDSFFGEVHFFHSFRQSIKGYAIVPPID